MFLGAILCEITKSDQTESFLCTHQIVNTKIDMKKWILTSLEGTGYNVT